MVWPRVRHFFETLGLVEPRGGAVVYADSIVDVESWSEFAHARDVAAEVLADLRGRGSAS